MTKREPRILYSRQLVVGGKLYVRRKACTDEVIEAEVTIAKVGAKYFYLEPCNDASVWAGQSMKIKYPKDDFVIFGKADSHSSGEPGPTVWACKELCDLYRERMEIIEVMLKTALAIRTYHLKTKTIVEERERVNDLNQAMLYLNQYVAREKIAVS